MIPSTTGLWVMDADIGASYDQKCSSNGRGTKARYVELRQTLSNPSQIQIESVQVIVDEADNANMLSRTSNLISSTKGVNTQGKQGKLEVHTMKGCPLKKQCRCQHGTGALSGTCPSGGGSKCAACNSGYFLTGSSCTAHSNANCAAAKGFVAGTSTSNSGCVDCVAGTSFSNGLSTDVCASVTVKSCVAGKGLTAATTSANGVCNACIAGSTFSANNNGEGCGAVKVKSCAAGKKLTAATKSADGVCTADKSSGCKGKVQTFQHGDFSGTSALFGKGNYDIGQMRAKG